MNGFCITCGVAIGASRDKSEYCLAHDPVIKHTPWTMWKVKCRECGGFLNAHVGRRHGEEYDHTRGTTYICQTCDEKPKPLPPMLSNVSALEADAEAKAIAFGVALKSLGEVIGGEALENFLRKTKIVGEAPH